MCLFGALKFELGEIIRGLIFLTVDPELTMTSQFPQKS